MWVRVDEDNTIMDLLKFVTHRTDSSGPHVLLCLGVQACTFIGLFASHRGSKGLSRCEPIRMDHGCISKWCKNKCDKINIIKPTKYFSSKVIYFPSITASEKTAIFFPIKFPTERNVATRKFYLQLRKGQQALQEIIVPKILYQTQLQENVKHAWLAISKTQMLRLNTPHKCFVYIFFFLIKKKLKILSSL